MTVDIHSQGDNSSIYAFDTDTIFPSNNTVPISTSSKTMVKNELRTHFKKEHSPINGQALSLRVTEHPNATFYKDEGGKSNHLTAAVVVGSGSSGGESASSAKRKRSLALGSMAIVPKLVYENGKEVEDADEIFTILSLEPPSVCTSEQPVLVKFRIEKVSRRKDGKKFKVLFDVDYAQSPQYRHAMIRRAETTPIVVLSKRKQYLALTGGAPQKNGQRKKVKTKAKATAAGKDEKLSVNLLHKMKATIENLERKVASLHERVGMLENENKSMRVHMKHEGLEPLEVNSAEMMGSDENFVNNNSNGFQPTKYVDKVAPSPSPLDYGNEADAYKAEFNDEEFGLGKPMMKRNKSNDLNHLIADWGTPTAHLSSPMYLTES